MSDLTEFKRMSFFTGFFTTADDWNAGQEYHLEKRRLHNRGLHTPGVIRGVGDELRVEAAGGLDVRVQSGVALDGRGNEICLAQSRTLSVEPPDDIAQLKYIAIEYQEEPRDWRENAEVEEYSGYSRMAEIPVLRVASTVPDNHTSVELARINLQPGVTEITNPDDPENPGGNQIDRRYVVWAGSVCVVEEWLPPEDLEDIVSLMQDKREDFAKLASLFPVPSIDDVRHAAVTVEILARAHALRTEHLSGVLATMAVIEQDVGQEIGTDYPAAVALLEYQAYVDAVGQLLSAVGAGQGNDTLLYRQSQVTRAALELSEVQPPTAGIANKEDLSLVRTSQDETDVELDAGDSEAYGGREIETYRWEKKG